MSKDLSDSPFELISELGNAIRELSAYRVALEEREILLYEREKILLERCLSFVKRLEQPVEEDSKLEKKEKGSFQAEFKKNLNKITGSSFLKAIGLAGTLTGFGNLIGTTILSCMGEDPSLDKRQVMLMNWGILAAVFVSVLAFSAFNHFYQNKQNNEQKPDSNIAESTVTESSDCKRSSFSS